MSQERIEQLDGRTPESQKTDGILHDMRDLAAALKNHPGAKAFGSAELLPIVGVGNLSWHRVGSEMSVKVTEKLPAGNGLGVEIVCHFSTTAEGVPLVNSNDSFQIDVPRTDERNYNFIFAQQRPDREYEFFTEEGEGTAIDYEKLADYKEFTGDIKRRAFAILEVDEL